MTGTIRVLHVEDSDFDAYFYKSKLEKDTNTKFEVTTVGSLAQADEMLATSRMFSVVLLDLNLPDSRGLNTLEYMIDKVEGKIPIVPLSGVGDEKTLMMARQMGASGFLVKTTSNNSIGSHLRQVVARNTRPEIKRLIMNKK